MFRKLFKSTGFVVTKNEDNTKWYWSFDKWVIAMSYAQVFKTKDLANICAIVLMADVEEK